MAHGIKKGKKLSRTFPSATAHMSPAERSLEILIMLSSQARKATEDDIVRVIGEGVDASISNYASSSVLLEVAAIGYKKAVKALLDIKAAPDIQDRDGYTALIYAAMKGHVEIVQLLLQRGAQPDIATKTGATALICAAWAGNTEVVKILLEAGANINLKDDMNRHALDTARMMKRPECIALLEKKFEEQYQKQLQAEEEKRKHEAWEKAGCPLKGDMKPVSPFKIKVKKK